MLRGGLKLSRRAPQMLILLDILMLWVFALLAQPVAEPDLDYVLMGMNESFSGFVDGTIITSANDRAAPEAVWVYSKGSASPQPSESWAVPPGLPNFTLGDDIAKFTRSNLPGGIQTRQNITIYFPPSMGLIIERIYYHACTKGRGQCGNEIQINPKGIVRMCGANGHWWTGSVKGEPTEDQNSECKAK